MQMERLAILVALALSLLGALRAEDDDEAPPEGFELRSYNIADLSRRPASLSAEGGDGGEIDREPLSAQDVVEIVKTAVAPDTWRAHGPAKISESSGRLV